MRAGDGAVSTSADGSLSAEASAKVGVGIAETPEALGLRASCRLPRIGSYAADGPREGAYPVCVFTVSQQLMNQR